MIEAIYLAGAAGMTWATIKLARAMNRQRERERLALQNHRLRMLTMHRKLNTRSRDFISQNWARIMTEDGPWHITLDDD